MDVFTINKPSRKNFIWHYSNINTKIAQSHQDTKELQLLDTSWKSFSGVTQEQDGRRDFVWPPGGCLRNENRNR